MRLPHRNTTRFCVCTCWAVLVTVSAAVSIRAAATQQLTSSPSSLIFGTVQVGQSKTQIAVLTNTGTTAVTISRIRSRNSAFRVTGASLPVVLAGGQTVGVNITFTPTTISSVSASVIVSSNASNSWLRIPVSGTGASAPALGQLSVSPAALSVGSAIVGSSVTASGSVSASVASVTISAASTNNTTFKLNGISLPATIAAGQSLPFTITFSPSAAGTATGTLSFTSNAQTPIVTESLSGTGTAPVGQLAVSPASLSFGSVTVGSSGSASGTLTASGATVTISGATTSNTAFKVSGLSVPATIAAGQSLPFTVTFSPSATGSATGTLSFTSNAQTPTATESLSGTGVAPVGQLAVSPASLSFGSVTVGSSGSASGTLSASGASVTISSDSMSNPLFKVSGLSLPITVPAGQSVPFTVTFSPTAAGSITGTLSFTSNAQTATVAEALSGTGTAQAGQLTVSPATLSFGNVDVGSNTTQACTVSASGAAVTLNSAGMSNAQFSLSGASFPMTLSAGQTAQLFVIFSPTASGTASGTLTLNSSASNAVVSEPLSGVGVTPQHTVTLSWSASTSSVAGYNIYRGTSPGSYTKINSTLDANTSYTDSTVVSGVTYYYAATAVTSGGQESTYSTPIQVPIP